MHQIYRILRDNKEKGPLSLEELTQLSLKPTDLIWVDGQSAGWRFPSEITSLKPYVESNPEINVQKPIPAGTPHPASQHARSAAVSMPAAPEPASNDAEEELTAEKLEKRANDLYQRIQAYSVNTAEQAEGVQTKYARSLDDLKQEYADWLHRSKKKSAFATFRVNNTLVWVGCLLVLALSAFLILGSPLSRKEMTLQQGENYVQNASTGKASPNKVPDISSSGSSGPGKKIAVPAIQKVQSVDEFIDSINRVMAKNESANSVSYKKPGYGRNKELTASSGSIADSHYTQVPVETAPPVAPARPESSGPLVNMNTHYEQEAHKKVSSLEVTIQNTSPSLIRTVTVDVFYYKKGEKLFEKQTLYFRNIPPGNSMTISKPGNKKAVSAKFQLGQIDTLGN